MTKSEKERKRNDTCGDTTSAASSRRHGSKLDSACTSTRRLASNLIRCFPASCARAPRRPTSQLASYHQHEPHRAVYIKRSIWCCSSAFTLTHCSASACFFATGDVDFVSHLREHKLTA